MPGLRKSTETAGIFVSLSLATAVATYLLIAVGALVRAAGAGLGCPDWPRCFGSWVPPIHAGQLPAGFDAGQFNAVNTWLEYVNRLIGVVIGLLIFATVIAAWRRHRHRPHVVWPATTAFVLVGFQGWLGGQVVANELDPNILTAHLVLALVIVGLLLYAHLCARFGSAAAPPEAGPGHRVLVRAGWLVALLVLVQSTLGTRVRGALQAVEKTGVARQDWLPLGWWPDLAHRQLAVIVALACIWLVWVARRHAPGLRSVQAWARWSVVLSLAQIAAGLGMAYGAVPRSLQVAHLALSSLLIGALTVYLFLVHRRPFAAPAA